MPLKVIRRPFQDCAYRWALSTSGISVGEGDCSEAQCADLNGDFLLDFSACDSKGGKLVWAGDCEASTGGGASECIPCPNDVLLTVPSITDGRLQSCNGIPDGSGLNNETPVSEFVIHRPASCNVYKSMGYGNCDSCGRLSERGAVSVGIYPFSSLVPAELPCGPLIFSHMMVLTWDICDALITTEVLNSYAAYYFTDDTDCDNKTFTKYCQFSIQYLPSQTRVPDSTVTWPTTISTSGGTGGSGGSTGPDKNDRIRSKWHLDYDINAQLWTLRSFNRIDYPVYTLSDASPCDGDTKTLLLADKGSAADGCGVAPAEMTITRVCPPDRVGKSALLEDRKPNGATGKRKRQCGCDCLDEVDDRRQCATKCTSAATEGCERIDPAPDDITCRYPEAINCCANTAGKDVPCAYTVEFECDLFFDIEDVRHKIAAKQVVLRRECYFEDPCLFVAPGPESSTGGSPVMDVDGFPGAQPVCSSCADLCLTGCTWSAYTVAACPEVVACGLTYCGPLDEFTIEIPAHTGNPCDGGGTSVPAITITLTYDSTSLGGALFRGTGTLATGSGDVEARVLMYLSENCTDLSVYIGGAVPCDPVAGTGWDYYDKTPSILSECPTTIVFRYTSALYGAAPPTELQTLTVTRV